MLYNNPLAVQYKSSNIQPMDYLQVFELFETICDLQFKQYLETSEDKVIKPMKDFVSDYIMNEYEHPNKIIK